MKANAIKIYETIKNIPNVSDERANEVARVIASVENHATKEDLNERTALLQRSLEAHRTETRESIAKLEKSIAVGFNRLAWYILGASGSIIAAIGLFLKL